MFGKRHDRQDANPWQQYWGESYGPELKQHLLKPVFGKLETEEKIGDLIIDVGSGASPATQLLKTKPARKRICVDIVADNVGSLDDLRIRLDAEKVEQFGTLSFREAIPRACAFLEIDPKTEAKTERADTNRRHRCPRVTRYLKFGRRGRSRVSLEHPDPTLSPELQEDL
jgi:hypothetical protein